jgi:hypothetical protein
MPDDEVGMRARGVTAALWRLAEGGDLVLEIEEDERGPRLKPVWTITPSDVADCYASIPNLLT